ncbi:hypothetical protein BJ322DRAFT_653377 [Thelephora terrestris]|uniref:Uncharacterized protein n=1 Tax=Thelephora terrestris TaxID=56493 RepID=A0A9P6LA28_9AGAM|nr:hypothetical protein BJ322DRAFT_653377 [Thelephora terrestris]
MVRRVPSGSNATTQILRHDAANTNLNQPRAVDNQSPIPATAGMSPSSRYNHNLKVLRRRDPSIVSIFDQFSHVCLYHHNGEKWEKKGYEGSMFLYEREEYPPYGFYILNRMGMDDYIQRMYPEDDMQILGEYLMYKCYPDYIAHRLGMRATDPELATDKHKGKAITVGLWMFAPDGREPMKDVMMRLYDYIKRGEPYPAHFRYGPDRPPPPNHHLRISNDSSPEHSPEVTRAKISITHSSKLNSRPQSAGAPASMSEIEKLFSKLTPEPSHSPIPARSGQQGLTLDGLFAAARSEKAPTSNTSAPANNLQTQSIVDLNTTDRSLALLDSIFASATPPYPNGHNGTGPLQPPAPTLQIISPQPTASTVPQVLNQNVISTLLGLAPSPGGSVSSSSTSINAYRYEGDNESNGEGGSEDIDYPTSNVNSILVEATRNAITSSSKGKQSSIPSFTFPTSSDDVQKTPRIQGDVTPRPALKGIPASSPSQQPKEKDLKMGVIKKLQNGHAEVTQPPPTNIKADKAKPAPNVLRKLIPFEPDSELWPYPRQPLDDRASDDDDIVELDFSETSALSDINTLFPKSKVNANATSVAGANGKKKKKEKNKEDREQIEKSWDDPVRMGFAVGPNIPNEPPVKPVEPQPAAVSSVKGKNKPAQANVKANDQPPASSSKDKEKTEGGLDRSVVTESLISTVAKSSLSKQKDLKQMDRNTFVREILTLFHTDKSFVDDFYADYLARS